MSCGHNRSAPTAAACLSRPMDSEFIRFKVDPQLRDKAAAVCAGLGHELADVLRALVTRIAQEGTLPFDMGSTPQGASGAMPFGDYADRFWTPLKSQLEAEVALSLLAWFIADCSRRIDDHAEAVRLHEQSLVQLQQDRDQARRLRDGLDVADAAAVRQVIEHYGPLVRQQAGGTA